MVEFLKVVNQSRAGMIRAENTLLIYFNYLMNDSLQELIQYPISSLSKVSPKKNKPTNNRLLLPFNKF